MTSNIFLLIVIFFLLGACMGTSKNPLVGKWRSAYTKKIGKVDLTIEFDKSNNFKTEAFSEPINVLVLGNYFVNGDTLTIKDNVYKPAKLCEYSDSGRYTFIRRNDSLFFKVIKDNCEKRKFTLEIGLVKND